MFALAFPPFVANKNRATKREFNIPAVANDSCMIPFRSIVQN